MVQSPQPLQTAAQHQTSVPQRIEPVKHLSRPAASPTKHSACPMVVEVATAMDIYSISKFVDANYIAIFDKNEVKIFDANNTKVNVSCTAKLRGWHCPTSKLWRIPLIKHITNKNTDTILCNQPLMEFLPEQPPLTEAVANAYELKTQPELVRYYHAAAGFADQTHLVRGD